LTQYNLSWCQRRQINANVLWEQIASLVALRAVSPKFFRDDFVVLKTLGIVATNLKRSHVILQADRMFSSYMSNLKGKSFKT
jgi:hypothetical protein